MQLSSPHTDCPVARRPRKARAQASLTCMLNTLPDTVIFLVLSFLHAPAGSLSSWQWLGSWVCSRLTALHVYSVEQNMHATSPMGLVCFQCSTADVQNNAQKISKRLRTKACHPAQLAADVVERVIATGGEHYLETHQHKLTWWQLSLLDVKACLAAVVLLLACLVFLCIVAVVRLVKAGWKQICCVIAGSSGGKGKGKTA